MPSKILIVDDDPAVGQALLEPLGRHGIKADKAAELESALYLFNTTRYDAVLLELEFEPMAGLALVQKWRAHDVMDKRATPFIMLAGNKASETHQGMFRDLGDLDLLAKPFGMPQLLPCLNRSVATRKRLLAILDVQTKVMSYYAKTKDFDKAAAHMKARLPEMGPQGLSMLYDLYEQGGKFQEALSVVDELLAKEGKNIALLSTKGRLLMRLGKFAEAKIYMKQADEAAPLNVQRLNDLGDTCLNLKDPDGAVKSFEKLLDLSPDKPDLKFGLFEKFFDHGFDEHAVSFGKAHAQPIEIVRHYNNKGVLLSKDGDSDQAITAYQRALNYYPKFRENYRILYNFALAQLNLKTLDAYRIAQKSLLQCLDLAPDFEKAKAKLKSVEQVLEKYKKAG